MTLVNLNSILSHAMINNYAVGAFNMVDINSMDAILKAAVKLKSPVIVSVAEIHFPYVDIEKMSSVICYLASQAPIPVALHLDHGKNIESIMKAIRRGFTSVMFDGTELPLAENMSRTAEIVRFAHAAGVSVEGELRYSGYTEKLLEQDDDRYPLTDPEDAALFVKATRLDALAIDIGTAHGRSKARPKLDFERLQNIKELTGIPLVLHGGSGLSIQDYKNSIQNGICKINSFRDLSLGANQSIRHALAMDPDLSYPIIKSLARQGIEQVVEEKIQIFGSENVV